jgi:AhpD family alkylhydroperoxidase
MDAKGFVADFGKGIGKAKADAGNILEGFGGLFGKAMGEGALSVKHKELIALAIAVAKQCEPCIVLHVEKSLAAGASKEEMLEACGVSVVMSGGPAFVHIPVVNDVIDQLMK